MDKEQFIIGTAGHIDHGKTTLVKALTGIDADTLPDEKRRGITIELGFVFMDDPKCDKQIMFIDVPGHEKLVRTMVAGASNIDSIMLVVAADEGVNLQTIEHFAIVKLLGISSGVVVLTKSDLVDAERLEQVTQELREFVADSFLADSRIMPVSSKTNEGLDALQEHLRELSNNKLARRDNGVFRMPIDRIFTIKGFGTIVAGTVLSGMVKADDQLELYPEEKIVSIRNVQVHNTKAQISNIGSRTALNLRDIKKEDLYRGQCLAEPKSLTVTKRLDANLSVLSSYGRIVKNGVQVRLHTGTAEIMARIIVLGKMTIEPGETALVQLVLDTPTAVLPRDRFIIRAFSPIEVIGGGTIIDAQASKHKRSDSSITQKLDHSNQNLVNAVEQTILKSGFTPLALKELLRLTGEDEQELEQIVTQLLESKIIIEQPKGYIHSNSYQEGIDLIVENLKVFLQANSFKHYMPFAELRSGLSKQMTKKQYAYFIEEAIQADLIVRNSSKITLKDYQRQWPAADMLLLEKILENYKTAQYAPTLEEELWQELEIQEKTFRNMISYLLDSETLIRLSPKVIYHIDTIEELKAIVIDYIATNGQISVAELRDILEVSRKYTLAILEYFDTIGITRRNDNHRVLK